MIDGWTGIDFLHVMQDLRLSLPDFVTTFFEIISSSLFYLAIPILIAVIFYWFIDKRAGDRIVINTLSAYNIVNFFKFMVKQPRPWILDPTIQPTEEAMKTAGGYSFPSGHSAIATSSYFTTILFTKRMFFKILLFVLIVLIVFARLFLCVHTPLDIIFGILIAVAVIIINAKVLDYGDKSDGRYYLVSLLYVIVFSILFISIMLTIDMDRHNTMTGMGLFYGMFISRVLDRRYIKYAIPPSMKTSKKIVYLIIGILGVAVFTGIPLALKINALCLVGSIFTGMWLFVFCPKIIMKYR